MDSAKVSGGKSKYSQTKFNLQNPISKEDTQDSRGYGVSRKDKDHHVGIVHPYFYLDAYYKQVTPANPVQDTQITNWTNKGTLPNQLTAIAASSSVVYTEEYQTPFIKFGNAVPTFQMAASTGLFNFIHTAGGEYSIYIVLKNTVGENSAIAKTIFNNNGSNVINRGFVFRLANDGDNRYVFFQVGNNVSPVFKSKGFTNVVATNTIYNINTEAAPYIVSVLGRNINQIGAICGGLYMNGILQNTLEVESLFGSGNTALNLIIGDRNAGGTDLNSSIGELAIYNVMHDQTTHNYIIQLLKEKYRI